MVAAKAEGNAAYRTEIGGNNLADHSVSARHANDEHAVVVGKTHRRAVDFELSSVAGAANVFSGYADQPLLPTAQLVVGERVPEREHRNQVLVLCQLALHLRSDAKRRRIFR